METPCDNISCLNDGTVSLIGPVHLCDTHFEERCADEDSPSMGYLFGPSILTLQYDPIHGEAVADGLVMSSVESKIREFIEFKGDVTHIIGSENLLYAYRLAIKRGYIAPYHVIVKGPNGEFILPDNEGNLDGVFEAPPHTNTLLMELC